MPVWHPLLQSGLKQDLLWPEKTTIPLGTRSLPVGRRNSGGHPAEREHHPGPPFRKGLSYRWRWSTPGTLGSKITKGSEEELAFREDGPGLVTRANARTHVSPGSGSFCDIVKEGTETEGAEAHLQYTSTNVLEPQGLAPHVLLKIMRSAAVPKALCYYTDGQR